MPNHQSRKAKELVIPSEIQEKGLQRSDEENEERKVKEEEGVKSKERRGRRRLPSPPLLSAAAQRDLRTNIALISKAILTSDKKKLLLCDIYQWIMDHYPYFQSKDKNWRNSVRHNLSLNECFIKVGRSDNGKGHFWAIHPSNYQDFSNGEYHCRRARRRVRRVAAQLPFASLGSHFYPGLHRSHPTPCWCAPAPTLPLSCLTPRFYWGWPSVQAQVGLHPGLHVSVP
ncbi:LOW QUALITY PROTEIN: forkhead box Q2 [Diretmus argenteus]